MPRDFDFEPKKRDMVMRQTPALRSMLDYLEKNLKKGYKMDDLKYMLLSQGYSRIDVDEAIRIAVEKTKKPQESEKPRKIQVIGATDPSKLAAQGIESIEEEQGKKGFWGRLFG